jgi:hypothetical protein
MRLYWAITGFLATGFFLTSALVASGPDFAKGDWYCVLFLVMAGLAALASWAGMRNIREAPPIFAVLAVFLGLFSFGPLAVPQAIAALVTFVAGIVAWIRQPPAPLSTVPRMHPVFSERALPWFWSVVAAGLGTFFAIDAGSFALRESAKTPANVLFAYFFLALTAFALVLAWRRVPGVAAIFATLSILCLIFSTNLGPYQVEQLPMWQLGGGAGMFILSLFGAVTVPSRQAASQAHQ